MMETKLARISQLSKQNPNMVFTSIGHLINEEMLKECHRDMDGDKAVGIDGITKEEYEANLEVNVTALVKRLKQKSYKPQPARRVEIPKDKGSTRPLNIYCHEDKLVQEALKRILEAVFEPHFYDEMQGFRPNRGCHQVLSMLNGMIMNRTGYIVDADIRSFFDHMDHEWIIKFVESRIQDPNITRLIRRLVKAGIMNGFSYEETEEGSGQGSVCSPILSCIYMHYVLLWWFKEKIQPEMKGFCGIVNYADDFVCCFQYKEEAERFYERLKHRMNHFGLSLAEEKSRLIEFGRFAESNRKKRGEGKAETFDFLGFTHYCSRSKNGKFRVKRKTSKKKIAKKCKEVHRKIGEMRTLGTETIIKKVNQILTGYFHYYGITDNSVMNKKFRYNVLKSLYYWLNRRSQRKSYTWERFYKGELYSMPFNMYTFNKMWGVVTPEEAVKKIEEQRREITGEPQNLEEQAISLVGRDIYEKLVKGYTEKQWGRDCKELPAFIIKRLPVRFTFDNNYFNALYQGIPIGGYTKMVENMLEGIEVRLGVDYLEQKEELDALAEKVIYTGPIDAYFEYKLGHLEYRSVRFENEVLNRPNFQGNAAVNYTDRETPWTRIIEHKWFEFGKDEDGNDLPKTIISREYSSEWKPGDEPYYPVNDEKNNTLYAQYKELAEKEEKVIFGGRLGEYKYYDMDAVIASALKMCEEELGE